MGKVGVSKPKARGSLLLPSSTWAVFVRPGRSLRFCGDLFYWSPTLELFSHNQLDPNQISMET